MDLRPRRKVVTATASPASDAAPVLARVSRSKQANHTTAFPAGDATSNMAAKSKNPFHAINLGKPTTVIKQAKSRINVGCWNVRSVKQEATQVFLVHEMEKYNIDILCISETRISGSGSIVITAPETLHQFHFFYSGVEDNSGLHGVGFIMNQRTRNALLEWEPVSCRLARIRLKGNPANVSIISTYAPTRDAADTTKDDFYGELQQLSSSVAARDYLIVAGDFNARVGPSDQTTRQVLGKFGQGHRCENGQRLLNYALMNHLVVTNTIFQHKPSHLLTWHSNDGVTKAQIDFILVRQRWRSSVQDSRSYNGADTGSQSGSDHRLVAAKILLRLATRRKNKPKAGFDIGKLQDKEVRQALNLELTNRFDALSSDENPTPEKRWETFKTVMTETADEILGRAKIKRQHWITARTLSIVGERRQKMSGPKEETKELRRQVKRSVRLDRRQMWEDATVSLEKAARSHDTRKLYQILKESVGKKAAVSEIVKDRSGKIISCQKERLARWKDHFQILLNPSPSSAPDAFPPAVSKEPYDVELDTPTRAEILKAIKTLKNHKAPGEDGLPPEVYKQCPEVTAEQLHGILEEVWRTNSFPKDWKTSVILPFYKKGDKTECKNYRGISLIDIAVKIFGIILLNRFKGAREERTRENQAGFRPGRGCTDNIFVFRLIIQQFERYNLPLILMFLDFIAAFDSVTRQKLWKILENDGMPLKFVELMKAYYDASVSRVRVYGEETEEFLVEFGVKQGCILSPTLFNYCVDWVLENALSSYPGVQIGQNLSLTDLDYADDVGLLSDPVEAQNMLDNVVAWADLIGLKVSTEKTKFMAINHDTGPFTLTVNQVQLEKVNCFTYLGSQICIDGSSDADIQQRIQKAQTVFASLRKPLWNRREVSVRTKVRIYMALVRTVLLYGCETWSVKLQHENTLKVFEHTCLRRILRIQLRDRISSADLRRMCNIQRDVALTIKERRLKWLGHVLRKPPEYLPRQILLVEPISSWKRRQGGQRKNWWNLAKSDLEPIGGFRKFGHRWSTQWLTFAEQLAEDRSTWSKKVSKIIDAGRGGNA